MDGETIITLLIIVVVIIWNLVVKIREKLGTVQTGPPFSKKLRGRHVELEDLGPISIIGEQTEHVRQIDVSRTAKDKIIESSKPAGRGLDKMARRTEVGETSEKVEGLPTGRRQLQQAVVWSEILAPPLALRNDNDMT